MEHITISADYIPAPAFLQYVMPLKTGYGYTNIVAWKSLKAAGLIDESGAVKERLIIKFVNRVRSRLLKPSVLALIAANLYPLFGVILLDWDVFPVLLFFWLENVVTGIYTVIKMLLASPNQANLIFKLFLAPFFCVHYGIFTIVHGIFVIALFGSEPADSSGSISTLFGSILDYHVIWGALALLISHGYSLFKNYIGAKEYQQAELFKIMLQPYGRVVILHVTIMAGGFLIALAGSPAAALVLLIVLKIAIDIWGHLRERKKYQEQTATAPVDG
jgi:hypothetical protein